MTISIKSRCNLPHFTMQLDANYTVIYVKLPYSLHKVAPRLNRDCQIIGYILFYGLSIIIR